MTMVAATAASCFAIGVYFQLDNFLRKIFSLIQNNPYAYYIRHKITNVINVDYDEIQNNFPPTRMQDIMKYDFPGVDDLRLYSDFVLSYDRRNRVAHWVYEHLQISDIQSTSVHRQNCDYQPDMSVPSLFRVDTNDYRDSGFDRGHLAAAGNHKNRQNHCNETFYLTNITPQVGKGFNRDAWNNLEIFTRELTERYGSVYVCTGPLYMPKYSQSGRYFVEYDVIGLRTVAVPTHFFKVIIVESKLPKGKPYMEAYIMPNARISNDTDLRIFLSDIQDIERLAGLKFFEGLRRSYFFAINYTTTPDIFRSFV